MRLPALAGLIRRRLLVNYRVDPAVLARLLPAPLRPKLHAGFGLAGICLIRLEQIRPAFLPLALGLSSENAAHRAAVCWTDPATGAEREGVYIARRDSGSALNRLAGGHLFPGEQHPADFTVRDEGARLELTLHSADGVIAVDLRAHEADALPADSCFASLAHSSAFFAAGSDGYSVTADCCRLDGMRLHTVGWNVRPLQVERLHSSFFADPQRFPPGSLHFDHALIMRDLAHRWEAVDDLRVTAAAA